jgi:putrescine:ornithine antiporter
MALPNVGCSVRAAAAMSAYTEEAHGKSGFFMCSFLYFLSLIIANVAIAISAVGYLSAFIPWLGSGPLPLFVGSLALIWLTAAANFGGPRITGRIGVVTVWGVVIPVAGAVRDRLVLFQTRGVHRGLEPTRTLPVGRRPSIPLTLWSFLGMESAAQGY